MLVFPNTRPLFFQKTEENHKHSFEPCESLTKDQDAKMGIERLENEHAKRLSIR